jgi:hypothetical protein
MQLHPLLLIRDSVSANKKNATLCHCKINISTIKIGHEVNKYRIMSARKVEKDINSSVQESHWTSCDTSVSVFRDLVN